MYHVRVIDTYSLARKNNAIAPSTSLKAAATAKHNKYDDICRNRQEPSAPSFFPQIVDKSMLKQKEDLLKRIAHSYSNKKGGSVQSWKTCLSIDCELTIEILKGSSICCRWSRAKVKWLEKLKEGGENCGPRKTFPWRLGNLAVLEPTTNFGS